MQAKAGVSNRTSKRVPWNFHASCPGTALFLHLGAAMTTLHVLEIISFENCPGYELFFHPAARKAESWLVYCRSFSFSGVEIFSLRNKRCNDTWKRRRIRKMINILQKTIVRNSRHTRLEHLRGEGKIPRLSTSISLNFTKLQRLVRFKWKRKLTTKRNLKSERWIKIVKQIVWKKSAFLAKPKLRYWKFISIKCSTKIVKESRVGLAVSCSKRRSWTVNGRSLYFGEA